MQFSQFPVIALIGGMSNLMGSQVLLWMPISLLDEILFDLLVLSGSLSFILASRAS